MSMSTGLGNRLVSNMSQQKGIHSSGANSGRDNVYKDHQYFDDAFYILYDIIMNAYDAWKPSKHQQKRQTIAQKLRPFIKEIFMFHIEPLGKRLMGSQAQKHLGQEFLSTVAHFTIKMDLKTAVVKKNGRSEHSKLTDGMGEKAIPFIQDVLYVLNEMEGDMVLANPDIKVRPASHSVATDHARQSLNITHL